ncbi:cyd operon protein YbgE [Vibrio agarilyticus]
MSAWHRPMDKVALRILTLVLGLCHVGLLMWEPQAYAAAIGGFNAFIAPALIWAVCSAMVYGVGFNPKAWYWQLLFSPYISLPILLYLTLRYVI